LRRHLAHCDELHFASTPLEKDLAAVAFKDDGGYVKSAQEQSVCENMSA
jgi:hypothetical protein